MVAAVVDAQHGREPQYGVSRRGGRGAVRSGGKEEEEEWFGVCGTPDAVFHVALSFALARLCCL